MPNTARHPSTTHVLRYFEYDHLPERLQEFSAPFAELANDLIGYLPDGPELTAGLRKLLEAKDCIVRAAVDHMRDEAAAVDENGATR